MYKKGRDISEMPTVFDHLLHFTDGTHNAGACYIIGWNVLSNIMQCLEMDICL